MNSEYIKELRHSLAKNHHLISELEYTTDNYDDEGKKINEDLPTITTEYCEIGLHRNKVYFVFIIKSKTFNETLFNLIKNKPNLQIYGFADFKTNLYPNANFDYANFLNKIKKDDYVQIQFNFKKIDIKDLYKEYAIYINIFKKNEVVVIDQRKKSLTKKQERP